MAKVQPREVRDEYADIREVAFQDGIDAAADYLDRNYGAEAAEFVAALNSQHWGRIRPREDRARPNAV